MRAGTSDGSDSRNSPSWAKRFSNDRALRPICCEIFFQLFPWRFCSLTRECSSSSENLVEDDTKVRATRQREVEETLGDL